jgi:hypothetical protein
VCCRATPSTPPPSLPHSLGESPHPPPFPAPSSCHARACSINWPTREPLVTSRRPRRRGWPEHGDCPLVRARAGRAGCLAAHLGRPGRPHSTFGFTSQGRPPTASVAIVGQKQVCYCSLVFQLLNCFIQLNIKKSI